jgi:hypothetical protein
MRRARIGCLAGCVASVAILAACEEPDLSLRLSSDKDTLVADGLDAATLTLELGQPATGAVVRLSASGGLLGATTALLDDGVATIPLWPDVEARLGPEGVGTIEVRAELSWSADEVEVAELTLTQRAPTEGPPLLFLFADPPAADADGASEIGLSVVARRVDDGAALTWQADGGALFDESALAADEDGVLRASAGLRAPVTPADVTVTVSAPGGASDAVVVRFVEPGTPQFDLTGTWSQISPARVRLRAGTLVPDPQCVVSPTLLLIELVQDGLQLQSSVTTCELAFPAVTTIAGEVTTTAPPSFVAAVPGVQATFPIDSPQLGAMYAPPVAVVVGGAMLDDPANDPLPTEPDDERVFDADGDGQPGMTVINSLGAEQNVVFRNTGQTRGRILSSVEILGDEPGDLVAKTENSVLSFGALFAPDVEGLPSVAQIVRVDGRFGAPDIDADASGDITCEEAIAAKASLFTIEPPRTPFDCEGIE